MISDVSEYGRWLRQAKNTLVSAGRDEVKWLSVTPLLRIVRGFPFSS